MGKVNITYDSLYRLSLDDLNAIAKGKNNEIREHWEMTRDIAYWTFKGHASKKSLKKTDVMKFHWDAKEEINDQKIIKIKANADKLRDLIKNGRIKYNA